MENSFKSIIERSNSILILLPTKPLFDQVGGALSLYLSLREQKEVQIFSPSAMTVEFNRLIGINKINQEIGSKNLIIRFVDYRANDIERVSYDIENGQFRLTVIPKQRINPPGKNQIELAYSGISADTVIIIGGANESHFPAISSKDLAGANIVHIGTQDITLSSGKNYVSFSKPASSVSEVIYALMVESGFPIDIDIATNLLMGIETSSDNFTSSKVTADTFFIISELMKIGGRRKAPNSAAGAHYPPGSIPGQPPGQQTRPQQKVNFIRNNQLKSDKPQESPPKDWLEPKIFKGGVGSKTKKGGNRLNSLKRGSRKGPSEGTSTS